MKYNLTITLLFFSLLSFGQEYRELSTIKFWTYGSDTGYATVRYDNGTEKEIVDRIKKNDTIYEYYINGRIKGKGPVEFDNSKAVINIDGVRDTCLTYAYNGLWTIFYDDSLTAIARQGEYNNHEKTGEWNTYYFSGNIKEKINYSNDGRIVQSYDNLGNLISSKKILKNGLGESRIVEESSYKNGNEIYSKNESLIFRFYYKNVKLLMIVFFISFFIRIPINHVLYNRKEKKSNVLFWFPGRGSYTESLFHGMRCMWTFWWLNYDADSRILVKSNLMLSIISILIFLTGILATILKKKAVTLYIANRYCLAKLKL